MNTSKIIKGVVGGGRYTVTAPIIKEDYGLYLQIEGLELPSTYEVDFSNDEHSGSSVTMIGNADGVLIPSQFISSGKDIFAFLYHVGEDFGRTVYKFRIPNKLRPDRTDEEPTPEEQSVIDQTIAALNDAVEEAEGYAQTASDKADSIHDMTATAQALPEGSEATASYDAETGVMSFGIPVGATGAQGEQGIAGRDGADGRDGVDGTDGFSPTVSVTSITGGHEVAITDAQRTQTFDVMDGQTPTVPVQDVQVNGTSVVSDRVANVPLASANDFGVIKVSTSTSDGVHRNSSGVLKINAVSSAAAKSGLSSGAILTAQRQHESVFYGLAKAAGDTTQSQSSNAVGTYTEDAKVAIQKMLGIYEAPWELIREDTFTNAEEADHIISTDANGETFELTDAVLFFYLPKQETYAKKGDYGHVIFCKNGTTLVNPECGQWEQQANANARGFLVGIEDHNGMVFVRQTAQVTLGYTANENMRLPGTLGVPNNAGSSITLIDNFSIDSVNITKVTGTGKYQLYGRRKWQ